MPIISNTPDPEPLSDLRAKNKTLPFTAVIGLELLAVMALVLTPLALKASWFTTSVAAVPTTVENTEDAAFAKLLVARTNPDPLAVGGGEIPVTDGALKAVGNTSVLAAADTSQRHVSEISVYVVREGDSLSQIAEMYGVTSNTIRWANDITSSTGIQPGDTLVILPIAGVQHEVEDGDTLASIVEDYEADMEEVLAFNGLTEDSVLSVGDEIMIPGGELHSAPMNASVAQSSSGGSSAGFTHPAPGAVRTQGLHGYNAVDLAGGYGSAIRAAASGEVIIARASGWNGGYGTYVVIRHGNGVQTLYAHMSSLNVGVGDWVNAGAAIGGMGSTGRSTGTHLHFEVRGASNPF